MKTGDVVQLKSGGPLMTVGAFLQGAPDSEREVGSARQVDVTCTWFNGGDVTCAIFHMDMLRPIAESDAQYASRLA